MCGEQRVIVSDLFRECVEEQCECRDAAVKKILDVSFAARGREYNFSVIKNDDFLISMVSKSCAAKTSVVVPDRAAITAELGTC